MLSGILWHRSWLGECDNIADVPSSVQEQKVPCIPITPALGWGSSPGVQETAQVGFGPCRELSPTLGHSTARFGHCTIPTQPLLELQGQGWRDLKRAAAPTGELRAPRCAAGN